MGTVVAILVTLVAVLAVLYGVLLLVVSYVSVRPPRIPVFLSPAMLGDPHEVVTITTEDGLTLQGWWVEGGSRTVIVCLHGYLFNRSEWLPLGPRLRERGASLLHVDFRCHGGSQRSKCTFGIDEAHDVRAAVAFARSKCPGCKVAVLGSSMGGAAAVRAVAEDPGLVDALVLDGAYANLDEAAKGFWYVTGFKPIARLMAPAGMFGRLWLGRSTRSVDLRSRYLKLQNTPVLFLFGTTDMVVPVDSAKECAAFAGGQVEWFEGSGHAQGRFAEPERYFAVIAGFLEANGLIDPARDALRSQETVIISSVSRV